MGESIGSREKSYVGNDYLISIRCQQEVWLVSKGEGGTVVYSFADNNSHSDKTLMAKLTDEGRMAEMQFQLKRLNPQELSLEPYLNARVRDGDREAMGLIEKAVGNYNLLVDRINETSGFLDWFKEHGLCVSREEVELKWSFDLTSAIFENSSFPFSTDIEVLHWNRFAPGRSIAGHIEGEYLISTSLYKRPYVTTIEGYSIELPIGEMGDYYPSAIKGKNLIWNWMENGRDFCCNLWFLLHDLSEQENIEDDEEPRKWYAFDDFYGQIRYDGYIEPQFVKVFQKLESLGYLTSYTIYSEDNNLFWKMYGKEDGSIDVATIDMSFRKNPLVMEQLKLLIWSTDEEVEEKRYFLTDENNRQYLSKKPGTFGGHSKLKIYGRLDCPSALRYIKNGQYVRHRVFFSNEEIAVAAGYRPCGKCMPEAYRRWKDEKEN